MYVIKSKAKNGGFWDGRKKTVVSEITVKDKATAENYKAKGFIVTETSETKEND